MRVLILAIIVSLASSVPLELQAGLQSSFVSSSTQNAPRADTTSNYVDWWQVRNGPGIFISCFGYNSGAAQFVQLFDTRTGPQIAVTAWDATLDTFTVTNHGLLAGTRIQLTNAIAGIAAGIYYASGATNATANATNQFYLYDTAAHAIAKGATGLQDVTGGTGTGTMQLLPIHSFAVASADNFSCIIPITGAPYTRGLAVALSSSGPTYTAVGKQATFFVTTQVQ